MLKFQAICEKLAKKTLRGYFFLTRLVVIEDKIGTATRLVTMQKSNVWHVQLSTSREFLGNI